MKMGSVLLLLIVCVCWTQANAAYNCTACDKRICQPYNTPCPGHVAIDPCGCCKHCAKLRFQVCGGADWEFGYCDRGLRCANITGTELVEIPDTGICKEFPGESIVNYFEDDDENCPEQSGCYRVMGTCDCPTKRSCILDAQLEKYTRLYCDPMYDDPQFEHLFVYQCKESGCDIVDDQCDCKTVGCDVKRTFQFKNKNDCYKTLMERLCANVTCPELKVPTCPKDSVPSQPHTPYGKCCPTIPSYCTCKFDQCESSCPEGKRKINIWKTNGMPGSCCDRYICLL
ncbi:cysteine-rich motor neuron 1 protein-like isoform 1-T2 [Mantella aurantiaca]